MPDYKLSVSLVMAAFRRSKLLDLGLSSIAAYKVNFPLEIVVVNDGIEDDTEAVCESYSKRLNIKYIFSGHRNRGGIKSQSPGLPINIGVKHASGDILVLTCPEIFHLDDCLNKIVEPLILNRKYLVVPDSMYFDDIGEYTNDVINKKKGDLKKCEKRKDSIEMPFLMGMHKDEILQIGGYDEDFTGYASEDNDLIDRMKLNGCSHFRVNTGIVHLYHGVRCDSGFHWEEPRWAQNRKLYESRKGQIIRNTDKNWGQIKLPDFIIEKNIEIPKWVRSQTCGSVSVVVFGNNDGFLSECINEDVKTKIILSTQPEDNNEIKKTNSVYFHEDLMGYSRYLKNMLPGITFDTALVSNALGNTSKEKALRFINELKKDFKKILIIMPAAANSKKDINNSYGRKEETAESWSPQDIMMQNFDDVIANFKVPASHMQQFKNTEEKGLYLCAWRRYKLARIPKKLHLYWDRTSRMSKLQTFTIDSFHRLNPDWPIYIYRPIQDYIGSDSYIPDFAGDDCFKLVEKKEYVNIINIDIRDYGISLDLHNILRSDILRYHLLYNYGGVWSDFDVIWLKPMDYFHNIEYIGKATPDEIGSVVSMRHTTSHEHNISVMMSSINNEFIKSLIDRANELQNSGKVRSHQVFGTEMLDGMYPKLSDVTSRFPDVVGLKYETFFPYSIINMAALYDRDDLHYINSNVMCIHWFNGHILSKKYVNENQYKKDCSMTSVLKKEKYI